MDNSHPDGRLVYVVRDYTPADAGQMARLYYDAAHQLGSRRYSPEQVAVWAPAPVDPASVHARASDGRRTLVAADPNGRVLAYGDLEADGHIDHLYCLPEAAGRGIAARILSGLIEIAQGAGYARLYVEASDLARGLFERHSFVTLRRRDFDLHGVMIHNHAMERRLVGAIGS